MEKSHKKWVKDWEESFFLHFSIFPCFFHCLLVYIFSHKILLGSRLPLPYLLWNSCATCNLPMLADIKLALGLFAWFLHFWLCNELSYSHRGGWLRWPSSQSVNTASCQERQWTNNIKSSKGCLNVSSCKFNKAINTGVPFFAEISNRFPYQKCPEIPAIILCGILTNR